MELKAHNRVRTVRLQRGWMMTLWMLLERRSGIHTPQSLLLRYHSFLSRRACKKFRQMESPPQRTARARKNSMAQLYRSNVHRFSSKHRFVNAAFAGHDYTVHRDVFSREHLNGVPASDSGSWHRDNCDIGRIGLNSRPQASL